MPFSFSKVCYLASNQKNFENVCKKSLQSTIIEKNKQREESYYEIL